MKAAILTAGCRLNQAESDMLRERLERAGDEVVGPGQDPDICYVNTCTVTTAAERSSMQLLRQAARLKSGPRVVVMGCLAEREPGRFGDVAAVKEVWGNRRKRDELLGFGPSPARSRAFLKVQDGCNRRCAYCVVSLVRGEPVSVPVDELERSLDRLVGEGFGEVVLTGLNLGLYRDGATDLAGLVRRLLERPGRFRIRLGSLEPDMVSAGLVDAVRDERVCPHFHLPLQTGDDGLLERMGRRYGAGDFARTVESLRSVRPDACIGADVICGLPGENDAAFERTRSLVADLAPAYLHVFRYSARPGTRAAGMEGQVPAPERKLRVAVMRRSSDELRVDYGGRFVGTVREAVVETGRSALTDNYLRLRVAPGAGVERRLVMMHIEERGGETAGVPTSETCAAGNVRAGPGD